MQTQHALAHLEASPPLPIYPVLTAGFLLSSPPADSLTGRDCEVIKGSLFNKRDKRKLIEV